MSIDPKNSPARRRRRAEGRLHVAALVATASLIAGTSVGTPTVAEDAPDAAAIAACKDAALDTQQDVTQQDVSQQDVTQQDECADEITAPAATAGDPSPADPPAADPPADTTPPAAGASSDATPAPATAAVDSAPAAPTAAQEPVASAETPAAPATAPTAAAPVIATQDDANHSTAAAKHSEKADTAKSSAGKDIKSHAAHEGDTPKSHAKKAKPDAKSHPDASKAPAENTPERVLGDAVSSYASLPASWTSLVPLSIPAFSVKGFPIPPFLLPIYEAAAAQYGVPWQVLASINEIETNFGRNASVSSAGAMGWMQFIYSSWKRWGTDSDADGRRDPRNPVDAVFAAARYLHDAGAAKNLPKAIFAYNHASWYVEQVIERAREFAGLDKTLVAALSERALREDTKLYRAPGNPFAGPDAIEPRAGQALLLTKRQLTRMVLHSDDIEVYPGGRQDIVAGHIDRRVLATLVFLARSGLKPTVSCLMTGHSLLTTSGNISAHSYGHAVDISAINGVPIIGHQGTGSITAKTLAKLVRLQGYLEPNQIISLMTVDGHDNTLAMGDHNDHIHVGFPRVPKVPDDGRPADIRELVASLRGRDPHH
ncbi:MAG: hypothetical protein QOJ89_3072 [bacterium]